MFLCLRMRSSLIINYRASLIKANMFNSQWSMINPVVVCLDTFTRFYVFYYHQLFHSKSRTWDYQRIERIEQSIQAWRMNLYSKLTSLHFHTFFSFESYFGGKRLDQGCKIKYIIYFCSETLPENMTSHQRTKANSKLKQIRSYIKASHDTNIEPGKL